MKEDPFIAGLRRIFAAKTGLKPATVSAQAGLDKSTIRRMLEGAIKSPRGSTSQRISAALGMTVEEVIQASGERSQPSISIAGLVGAGAQVPLFDAYEKGTGPKIECPPGLSASGIVAVEISGDSMEPVYSHGDVLLYSRSTHEGVPTEAVGKRCVCEDEHGMAWVKQVRVGTKPLHFNLVAINPTAQNQLDVRLKWAAPIKLHWPQELVKKVEDFGPN